MKVYCCQLDIAWENKPENFRKVRSMLAQAQPERGSMVVLPEMFSTGFSMNVAGISEQAAAGAEQFIHELAADFGVYVVGGIVNSGAARKGLNVALVVSPQGQTVT